MENTIKYNKLESIGLVYTDMNNLNAALNHLTRALKMYKQVLPEQHVLVILDVFIRKKVIFLLHLIIIINN
jgi:hypothetical protein